jgi:transposase
MYLKETPYKSGRVYLSACTSYRDRVTKQPRMKTVKSFGYVDELEKQYKDPIAHFKQVVKDMQKDIDEENEKRKLTFDFSEEISEGETWEINIGYFMISKIYHMLGLKQFIHNKKRKLATKVNLDAVMKLLVYERILNPCSKIKTYDNKDSYFEALEFSDDSMYRALGTFSNWGEEIQKQIYDRITKKHGSDKSMVFYDVTNYFFYSERTTELKHLGHGKENRPKPIIQMGLFMDTNGFPITYELFAGNMNDVSTLMPITKKIIKEYGFKRTIVVADKGINSTKNILSLKVKKQGYVFSKRVRNSDKEYTSWMLDEKGYIGNENFRYKSRVAPRQVSFKNVKNEPKKAWLDEKHIVYYSEKYAKRQKMRRKENLKKAVDLINNPSKYTKSEASGFKKYLKNVSFDKKTGEVIETKTKNVKTKRCINEELVKKEELLDGYYSIITSELDMSDREIIETYRGLWKIEETFKITKSDLETRPVYLSNEAHIKAHFLICYISLAIIRLLQKELDNKYSSTKIIESIKKTKAVLLGSNIYKLLHTDEIIKQCATKWGIAYGKKYMTHRELRTLIGDTKK